MAGTHYQQNLVDKPAYEVGGNQDITGRQNPTMTYLSNDLVPGSDTYIEIGWVYEMPEPNPHIHEHDHDYPEIVMHIGADPDNPEELGAEIEFVVGGEKIVINKTSALFIPEGVEHGPLTWKRVDVLLITIFSPPTMNSISAPSSSGLSGSEPICITISG